MDFVPSEQGVPIRPAATANLMVDSADRNLNTGIVQVNPFDFQIQRNQSLFNGFFTRVGTTEVVLEWNEPNGAYLSTNGGVPVLLSTSSGYYSTIVNNIFAPGFFYTAGQGLNAFVDAVNVSTNTALGNIFSISTINDLPALQTINTPFQISTCSTSQALGLGSVPAFTDPILEIQNIRAPDLRPFRYLDFVSEQLTYNQDLKDSSTARYPKDVLCRWYMDWDQQPQRDQYGFPIEMGYEAFKIRRLFNPPKQIKWDTRMPVGNISFKVYGDNQPLPVQPHTLPDAKGSQFLMTLQTSET